MKSTRVFGIFLSLTFAATILIVSCPAVSADNKFEIENVQAGIDLDFSRQPRFEYVLMNVMPDFFLDRTVTIGVDFFGKKAVEGEILKLGALEDEKQQESPVLTLDEKYQNGHFDSMGEDIILFSESMLK